MAGTVADMLAELAARAPADQPFSLDAPIAGTDGLRRLDLLEQDVERF